MSFCAGAGASARAVLVRDRDGAFRAATDDERFVDDWGCVRESGSVFVCLCVLACACVCCGCTGRAGAAPVLDWQPPRRLAPNIYILSRFVCIQHSRAPLPPPFPSPTPLPRPPPSPFTHVADYRPKNASRTKCRQVPASSSCHSRYSRPRLPQLASPPQRDV
jgi:hypothetical protein